MNHRLVALFVLVASGCGGADTASNELPIDPELAPDLSRIRISAVDTSGRFAIVGLSDTLPGDARFEVVDDSTGDPVAVGTVGGDGSFAVWATSLFGRPVLRAEWEDGHARGPDAPLDVPASASLRPVVSALTAAEPLPDFAVRLRGVVGAAPGMEMLVVGGIDTVQGKTKGIATDGSFDLDLPGNPNDKLLLFVTRPTDTSRASIAIQVIVTPGDFPVLVSGRKDAPGPVLMLGGAGTLAALSELHVKNIQGAPVSDTSATESGAFGACGGDIAAGDVLHFSGTAPGGGPRATSRVVPAAGSLPAVLKPGLAATITSGAVTLEGKVDALLGAVALVSCATGQTATAGVANTGEVTITLSAGAGELLAVVGIGRTGEVGQAELVIAGASEALPLPLPAPSAGQIEVSVATRGEAVVAGLKDAVLPIAHVEVSAGGAAPLLWSAGLAGGFAGLVPGVAPGSKLTLTQVVGPYRSAPLELTVPGYVAGTSPLPVVEGLVSSMFSPEGYFLQLYQNAAPPGDVVYANVTRSIAARAKAGTERDIGGEGDTLAVFSVSDGGTSPHALRTSQYFDPPALVSAAGTTGCAVAPFGGEGIEAVSIETGAASIPVPIVHGLDGAWFGAFSGINVGSGPATLNVSGTDQTSVRPLPAIAAVSPAAISVYESDGQLVVADGGQAIGPEWVVVIARADGGVAVVRPPTPPPWTVQTALAPSADLYVFAVDASTATASACVHRAPDLAEQGPPAIDQVTPDPLVVSKKYAVSGTNLLGGVVTIAGVEQIVTTTASEAVAGVVAEGTPLGAQILRVTTSSGWAEAPVTVVDGPVIETVLPDPLVIGKVATVSGKRFGESPAVTLGNVAMALLTAQETEVGFTVPPEVLPGERILLLDSGVGTDATTVTVACLEPIVDSATPDPAFLGGELAIAGDHLLGADVTVGGVYAKVTGASDTLLIAVVDIATPEGPSTVEVSTSCGFGSTTVTVATAPPVIDDTSPKPAIVGAALTVLGNTLAGAEVTLGGVPQVLTSDSAKSLIFTVATGTPLGAQTLKAKTFGGEASAPVIVVHPPIVMSVSPDPVKAGALLTIAGEHLLGGAVTVGGVAAAVQSDTDGQLEVLVAADTPAGLGDVVVTTIAGSDSEKVTVLGPPIIVSLDPEKATLGKKLSIVGKSLAGAAVTIGGVEQAVSAAVATLIDLTVAEATPLGVQTLTVTTAGGQASTPVKVIVAPAIALVTPAPLGVGKPFTVKGTGFAPGATTVTIGNVEQSGATSTATEIEGIVAAATPLGDRTLTVTTADGFDSTSVTVVQGPIIDSVSPDPVKIAASLTVNGKHLGAFTKVTLGGVVQNVFSTITDTHLVFKVVAATPIGPGQTLVVTTAGGQASATVDVAPAAPVGPTIIDVQPGVVAPGDTITVIGTGFDLATFAVGGLPAAVLANATDLQVLLVIPDGVGVGLRYVVASETGFPDSEHPVLVKPPVPDPGLIYVSAVSVEGDVGMVGLPGAFVPGATVEVMVGLDAVTRTAHPDGTLSLLFHGVEAGEDIRFVQSVEDATSGELVRTLEVPNAIPAPHPYLLRVELVPGGVEVYGPAPSFGPAEHLVLGGSEGHMGFATSAELHADPTKGLVVSPAGTVGEQTFVFTSAAPEGPASPPLLAYAVPIDPPMLSSSLHAGTICLVGLDGTIAGDAVVAFEGQGGSAMEVTKIVTTPGPAGAFLTLAEATGGAFELVWSGAIGGEPFNTLQSGADSAPIATGKVTVAKAAAGGVSVTVTGAALGRLVVAATSDGAASSAFGDAAGDATVLVPGDGALVYVFAVPLGDGDPTGCLILPAP